MRPVIAVMLMLALVAPWSAQAVDGADACSGTTQTDMTVCAFSQFTQADTELNQVWHQIQTRYADKPLFLARLKVAQRAWLAFRDAEVDATFPIAKGQNPREQYGSVYPMCISQTRTTLTRQRIKQLRAWLDGIEEGDVCAGSVKRPNELRLGSKE